MRPLTTYTITNTAFGERTVEAHDLSDAIRQGEDLIRSVYPSLSSTIHTPLRISTAKDGEQVVIIIVHPVEPPCPGPDGEHYWIEVDLKTGKTSDTEISLCPMCKWAKIVDYAPLSLEEEDTVMIRYMMKEQIETLDGLSLHDLIEGLPEESEKEE